MRLILLFVLTISFTACSITHRNGAQKDIKDWPPTSTSKNKPTLRINLKTQHFFVISEAPYYPSKPSAEEEIEESLTKSVKAQSLEEKMKAERRRENQNLIHTEGTILSAFKESALFSKITTDPNAKTDLVMDVKHDVQFNQLINFCCSCCFLDIIPSSLSFENRLIATLKKPNGDIVGTYSLNESISQKRHILLIFIAPFTKDAEEVFKEVTHDLTRAMLVKANKDINKLNK